MTPGYGKIWEASEVWGGLESGAFLAGVSSYMLWTSLRGVPARLSARAQRYIVLALSALWIACVLASFTIVSASDVLALTVWLILVLCPLCILVLLAHSAFGFGHDVNNLAQAATKE